MDKKRYIFLGIYGIIIVFLLIFIMFIAPDSMFLSKEAKEIIKYINENEVKEYTINEQIDNLINADYNYSYSFLDSMTTQSLTYKCTGTKKGNTDLGKCSSPNTIEYTSENKKEKLSPVNLDYVEINKIAEKIKDIEPQHDYLSGIDTYTYNMKINDLNTDIVFYSADYEIIEITIVNGYMIYSIKINPNSN